MQWPLMNSNSGQSVRREAANQSTDRRHTSPRSDNQWYNSNFKYIRKALSINQ